MEEMVNLFVNNGVAVACLIYFMLYNNNTLKEFTSEFDELNTNLLKIIEKLSK